MKIIIALRQTEEGNVKDIYFYGTEKAPLEISAIYWAVRQGGWDEPEEAYRETLRKMILNLHHLGMDETAVPEAYAYATTIVIDYQMEEITVIDNTRNRKVGMSDWIEIMDAYFEENVGNGSMHDAIIWMQNYRELVY